MHTSRSQVFLSRQLSAVGCDVANDGGGGGDGAIPDLSSSFMLKFGLFLRPKYMARSKDYYPLILLGDVDIFLVIN